MNIKIQCLLIYLFITDIFSYLSPSTYLPYLKVDNGQDYNSEGFYNSMYINYFTISQDPSNYINYCPIGTVFGYFGIFNVTNYFDLTSYTTIGINFKLLIKTRNFQSDPKDRIDFLLNHQVVYKANFSNIDTNPLVQTLDACNDRVYAMNISLLFTNNRTDEYRPILLEIVPSMQSTSTISWSVTNFDIVKVDCPVKCSVCTINGCVGCNKNGTLFKPNTCVCDSTKSLFDYADVDEDLDCQSKLKFIDFRCL